MIGDADEREVDLQWCSTHQPCELCFGLDLVGHQVEKAKAEGADVLSARCVFGHDHHAFFFKNGARGQVIGNSNWHFELLLFDCGCDELQEVVLGRDGRDVTHSNRVAKVLCDLAIERGAMMQ
jgi:hypothetical protein